MESLLDVLRHIVNTSNLFAPSDKEKALRLINDADDSPAGESGSKETTGNGGEGTNA